MPACAITSSRQPITTRTWRAWNACIASWRWPADDVRHTLRQARRGHIRDTGSPFGLGFATSFLLAGILLPDGRGQYALLVLVPGMLNALGQLGLPSALSFFAGRGRSLRQLQRLSLILTIGLSAILVGAAPGGPAVAVVHAAQAGPRRPAADLDRLAPVPVRCRLRGLDPDRKAAAAELQPDRCRAVRAHAGWRRSARRRPAAGGSRRDHVVRGGRDRGCDRDRLRAPSGGGGGGRRGWARRLSQIAS